MAHSFDVARLTRAIAESEGAPRAVAEDAFLAGMLHDVGKLVFAAGFPAEFERSIRLAGERGCGAAEAALAAIFEHCSFSVIVSYMRMPCMYGLQLLRRARDCAPDTVRMMLTGNADQQTAIDAVNAGAVFRFLNKPCDPETLREALSS